MTSYTVLADQMTAAGIKSATPAKARDLAERSMYGLPLTEQETKLIEAWVKMPWEPTRSRQKPTEGE